MKRKQEEVVGKEEKKMEKTLERKADEILATEPGEAENENQEQAAEV